jgi:hypothetical protein
MISCTPTWVLMATGLRCWLAQSTSGRFLAWSGTFVVESHRLGETIVILNVH